MEKHPEDQFLPARLDPRDSLMIVKKLFVTMVIVAAYSGPLFAQPSTSKSESQPMEHAHSMIQIPEAVALPGMSLSLDRDKMSGFNLQIETQNFELEPPELAGCCDEKVLEGHAHIFINGVKIYRAYSPYIHLPADLFLPGINQIMVSLNDHEHNTWSLGSKMLMSTLVIDTTQEQFLKHRFVSILKRQAP